MRTACLLVSVLQEVDDLQEEHVEDEIKPKGPKIQKCCDRSPVLAARREIRSVSDRRLNITMHTPRESTCVSFWMSISENKGGPTTYLVLIKDKLVVEVELERIGESRLLMTETKKKKDKEKKNNQAEQVNE